MRPLMINSRLPAALACCLLLLFTQAFAQVMSPIEVGDRTSFENIQFTAIGKFGLIRKARPTVPSHVHTGIDIRRPANNYNNEPIYPVAKGVVISKRTDGPFAILIVVHERADRTFW